MTDDEGFVYLVSVRRDDQGPIRTVGVSPIHSKERADSYGIMVGGADRRRGDYGAESTRLVLKEAFDTLNLNRVELLVFGLRPFELD